MERISSIHIPGWRAFFLHRQHCHPPLSYEDTEAAAAVASSYRLFKQKRHHCCHPLHQAMPNNEESLDRHGIWGWITIVVPVVVVVARPCCWMICSSAGSYTYSGRPFLLPFLWFLECVVVAAATAASESFLLLRHWNIASSPPPVQETTTTTAFLLLQSNSVTSHHHCRPRFRHPLSLWDGCYCLYLPCTVLVVLCWVGIAKWEIRPRNGSQGSRKRRRMRRKKITGYSRHSPRLHTNPSHSRQAGGHSPYSTVYI